jgi:hypothetical protein
VFHCTQYRGERGHYWCFSKVNGILKTAEKRICTLYNGGIVCREQLAATLLLKSSPKIHARSINRGGTRKNHTTEQPIMHKATTNDYKKKTHKTLSKSRESIYYRPKLIVEPERIE